MLLEHQGKIEMDSLETFNAHRNLLFSIAYRMLGSAADAEDVVQESFLRWQSAGDAEVRAPRAFLSTVVTRLCIDQLRSAQARREVYVGPWLPEPVLTGEVADMTGTVELAESLSFAFMRLLESLSPVERAVFLLREVFAYTYPEIARITGKSEANCRQMVHRAQKHLREKRPRFGVSREQQEQVTQRFLEVCAGGDIEGLLSMLSPNVTLTADGGGKVRSPRNVLFGPQNVARFLAGVLNQIPSGASLTAQVREVNGKPAIVAYIDDTLDSVLSLDCIGDQVVEIFIIRNPEKLGAISGEGHG